MHAAGSHDLHPPRALGRAGPHVRGSYVYCAHAEPLRLRSWGTGDPLRNESIDPRGRIGLIEAVAPSGASPSAHLVGVRRRRLCTPFRSSTPFRLACWPRCSAWPGLLQCLLSEHLPKPPAPRPAASRPAAPHPRPAAPHPAAPRPAAPQRAAPRQAVLRPAARPRAVPLPAERRPRSALPTSRPWRPGMAPASTATPPRAGRS